MSGYSIQAYGHGPTDAALVATFSELMRSLRAVTPEGSSVGGSLSTATTDLVAADIPADLPADDNAEDA